MSSFQGLTHDVFISHSESPQDREWVKHHLLPALKGAGLSVFSPDWDYELGVPIVVNAERAIEASRHVLLVLTPDWVQSAGNDFESLLASSIDPAGRARKLIPLLVRECQPPRRIRQLAAASLLDEREQAVQLQRVVRQLVVGPDPPKAPPPGAASPGAEAPGPALLSPGQPPDRRKGRYVAAGLALLLTVGGAAYLLQRPPVPVPAPPTSAEPERKTAPLSGAPAAAQPAAGTPQAALSSARRINLLAKEEGGQVVAAPTSQWEYLLIDNEHNASIGVDRSGAGVFAFKDERSARFDTFTVLMPGSDNNNLNEFELLAGNESPTGHFESIGSFKTQNVRLKSPYQEFKFAPVKAKYLKVQPLSSHWNDSRRTLAMVFGFQLFGTLD